MTVNMIPATIAIPYNKPTIIKFSFIGLLYRKSTNRPTPAPVDNPATVAGKLVIPDKYSSVSMTDAPQLGINPMIAVKKICPIEFFKNMCDIVSVPTDSKTNSSTKLIKKM